MATPSPKEEPSEALKYQKWVLKVSIHCEGCKKKVYKILQNINGVYKTDIDAQQNKVTVIGNVDADTLIKKLLKQNKHAELWPTQKSDKKPSKSSGGKNDKEAKMNDNGEGEKKSTASASASKNGDGEKKAAANEKALESKSAAKASEEESAGSAKASTSQVKEPKKTENPPAGNPTQSPADEGSSENASTGSGGKKKKKKGQAGNNTANGPAGGNSIGDESHPGGAVKSGEHFGGPAAGFVHSPPRQQPYAYPYLTAAPPQPVYVMSYNTAHPSMNYGASYYAAPPAYYAHHAAVPDVYPPAPTQSGSYDTYFSDENPNGCSVM